MFPDFKILRYFTYTSIVTNVISEYDSNKDDGCQIALEMYEEALKQASEQNSRMTFKDNKSAFEILVKDRVMYVGFYDGVYKIGLGISGIGGNRVYDFTYKTMSEYGRFEA